MNKNHVVEIVEFIGKVVWGVLVLNIGALMFLFLSLAMSIRIHNERTVIIVSSVVLLPFIAGLTLAGFHLISRKVYEINWDFRSISSSINNWLNNKTTSTRVVQFGLFFLVILSGFLYFLFYYAQTYITTATLFFIVILTFLLKKVISIINIKKITHTTNKIPHSPYIVGPPIEEPEHFYGRQAEVNQFFAHLNAPQPQPLQVLGLRGAGKTSFLCYVSHPDVVRKKVRNADGTLLIYIDLQSHIKTVADFYHNLAERINDRLPETKRLGLFSEPTPRAFERWLNSPLFANYRLIILLDEFEALRDAAGFDADFFKGLRSLVSRRLAWVTSSYRDLYCSSGILGEEGKTSSFFNVFHPTPIILGGLTQYESDQLIKKFDYYSILMLGARDCYEIKLLAGKLPFFLQTAAEAWFNAKQQGRESSQIKAQVKQELANAMKRHFDWYWRNFDDKEKDILVSLATNKPTDWSVYQGQDGGESLNDLLRYGLITQEGENYQISGEVFADWIRRRANHSSTSDLN